MRVFNIEIEDEVLSALKIPPDEVEAELRKALADSLYARRVLPLGKARMLAKATRWEFEDLLTRYKVPRDYTEKDLEEDLRFSELP